MSSVHVAVVGCGHGTLNEIYSSLERSCEEKGWGGKADLLIICGDFQACRNQHDLNVTAMPAKYRRMADFHEYYSGIRKAPCLTLFVGGNHEASNYLFELYYGGWVAPNIYYMGAANILRFGPLRIAGLSGIFKPYNYKKPHFERLPYTETDYHGVYHVRELDVRKLLNVRTQIDIGISHDWPQGVEWYGNHAKLFQRKAHLRSDAERGKLGSPAAKRCLDRLRPAYWFSAHLHVKYLATIDHANKDSGGISSDLRPQPASSENLGLDPVSQDDGAATKDSWDVSQDLRTQLASISSSFASPQPPQAPISSPLPFPRDISNTSTNFLALDKCEKHRQFLDLVEVSPISERPSTITIPARLSYDKEWLAITRVFADELELGGARVDRVPPNPGEAIYGERVEQEKKWVDENIVQRGLMIVPENFTLTAPAYDPHANISQDEMPREFPNPQTDSFCKLIGIENKFAISDDEIDRRIAHGPRPQPDDMERRGKVGRGRGGFRGTRGYRSGRRG